MKPFNLAVRNRLLDSLLQVKMVGEALVGVAIFFSECKVTVFKPLQHIAGFVIQFIEKHVIKQWTVRRNNELQI